MTSEPDSESSLAGGLPALPPVRGFRRGAPEPIAALNRVRILEYAEPWHRREQLVDIRTVCPGVIVHRAACAYLRERVAEMLNNAQAALPPGYRLKVGTALRTISMQQAGWDGFFSQNREAHPSWPLSALRRATNRYFAPYDQKAPPGHCTGGAVDVGLIDGDGNDVDLSSPLTGWNAAYTWSEGLSPEARANRMLLVDAMLRSGFSNCRDEFWHYSYGDSAWAVRQGEPECPYGWAHPPAAIETDVEGAAAERIEITTYRDPAGRPTHSVGSFTAPIGAQPARPSWRVLVKWAKQVPVSLRVVGGARTTPRTARSLQEEWTAIHTADISGEDLLIGVTPESDCIILSSFESQSLDGSERT
ncbi:MAG TPA: M15 family metallopeptidase [Chthonomonadales bacterium]|nr:M15 family metallopeptidase [Chthonomonadales bacterium]